MSRHEERTGYGYGSQVVGKPMPLTAKESPAFGDQGKKSMYHQVPKFVTVTEDSESLMTGPKSRKQKKKIQYKKEKKQCTTDSQSVQVQSSINLTHKPSKTNFS